LHDVFPNANAQNARKVRLKKKFARFRFLQPGVLPVLTLALIVGGWSYGLKLSHYLHNSDLTKASTTRMWVDQRNDLLPVPVQHEKAPQEFLSLQLCVLTAPSLPHLGDGWPVAEPAQSHTTEFVSPLHPLRAPPISSSLA
jgi:hypothetical protein